MTVNSLKTYAIKQLNNLDPKWRFVARDREQGLIQSFRFVSLARVRPGGGKGYQIRHHSHNGESAKTDVGTQIEYVRAVGAAGNEQPRGGAG